MSHGGKHFAICLLDTIWKTVENLNSEGSIQACTSWYCDPQGQRPFSDLGISRPTPQRQRDRYRERGRGGEKERERKRGGGERETGRQTGRHRDRHKGSQTETNREIETELEGWGSGWGGGDTWKFRRRLPWSFWQNHPWTFSTSQTSRDLCCQKRPEETWHQPGNAGTSWSWNITSNISVTKRPYWLNTRVTNHCTACMLSD